MVLQLHEQHEVLSMWSLDVFPTSGISALRQFGVAVSVFVGFLAAVNYITPERPAIPRTYPHSGLVTELGGLEVNKVSASPSILQTTLLRFQFRHRKNAEMMNRAVGVCHSANKETLLV